MIGRRCLLAGAALVWPLAARAQDAVPLAGTPVVGFLSGQSPETSGHLAAAFREGLAEAGHVEGRNLVIEYRWAEGQIARLPSLAADLVGRGVAAIFTGGISSALAAKAATSSIPIVFTTGGNVVAAGLVASLNRPGGNLTGVNLLTTELEQKRLGLLRDLLPAATTIAVLINGANPNAGRQLADLEAAAQTIGIGLRTFPATTVAEIEAAFAGIAAAGTAALLVGADPFFYGQRDRIVALAARHRIPAIYDQRDYALAGGLMSYGTNVASAYRQAGRYVGRMLDGESPAELPVIQSAEFEFIVNLRTVAALGLTLPPEIMVMATEVIE